MNLFAQSIYLARIERGLSQKELALRAGVPQPNLSHIEKGRDFKVSTLLHIAAALDVSIDTLINGSGPIEINKKNFFKRNNIEKAISCVVHNKNAPKRLKSAVKLIYDVAGKKKGAYISKRSAHLSWYNLKKSFSGEEIKIILSRLRKAERRSK